MFWLLLLPGPFKGRASIDGATMTLRGVTQKDSGAYHCEVTARQDKIKLGEVTVTLNVLGGHENPFNYSILYSYFHYLHVQLHQQ